MSRASARLRLLQAFFLGLPLWWLLGVDFVMPHLLCLGLLFVSLTPHRRFRVADWLALGVILSLTASAFLVGFVAQQEPLRTLAAFYNISLWCCGLIILQQARETMRDAWARDALLRVFPWSFALIVVVAWSSFALAFASRPFNLSMPSLFGLLVGDALPRSIKLLQDSAVLVFTQEDWGLHGVPTPRVAVFSPYPTAAAALIAVVGCLALLALQRTGRRAALIAATEMILILTLALTLTRTVIAGWALGTILANLRYGSAMRRVAAVAGAVAVALLIAGGSGASMSEYRQYSTETRFENYLRAIDVTLRTNPLIGVGIKERDAPAVQAGETAARVPIPLGSHSTWVSSFTRGGAVTLAFVLAYLVVVPGLRWARILARPDPVPPDRAGELRVLFALQAVLWIWVAFEDIDAPAMTAMHVFLAFAWIEAALDPKPNTN